MTDITETLREDLYEKTRKQLNTFLNETNELLTAGDALHEDRTAQARQRLTDFLANANSTAVDYDDTQTPVVTRVLNQGKAYVQTHPWAAVGAAAGIGLVVSLLLKRNSG
ncbi:hypothetical protein [Pseudomonas sp. F3-2]|uniref:glycine zipper domain-containing protein n=1 Tax=Pseudomonas sp. F3-2 TaxID=3141539 RepID=UPI00315D8C00